MQRVKDADAGATRSTEDLAHVRNALVGFRNSFEALPNLAAFGNEIVVRINHHQARAVLVIDHVVHLFTATTPSAVKRTNRSRMFYTCVEVGTRRAC
jgi:hypothetical protein